MEDYKKIGLKAGLEIHQQLNSHKLFCSCPSLLRSDSCSFKVERKLNPVVGETGEIDVAASYEKSKDKTFIYEVYDTNCLVELDEEPPHSINRDALKIAVQIALLLNCKIVPVAQVMRKTVVDGSNTSGFQRTVLIAHDGWIDTSFGKVAIDYLMLEEDSARPSGAKDNDLEELGLENSKSWKLDRLGIPLVEIATGPHMHTPEQIKEAALKLGEILRACNVRRGIGTIRQDVNISIAGSERVEIKGFQDPRMMIATVDKEIERQKICIKEKSCRKEVRKANDDGSSSFMRPMPGAARMYPETDVELLKISRDLVNEAKKTLPKLKSELRGYLKEFGLNDELVKLILEEDKFNEFKDLLQVQNNPNLVAKVLTVIPKEIGARAGKTIDEVFKILNLEVIEGVLSEVDKKIGEGDVKVVLQKIYEGSSLEDAMKKEQIDLAGEINSLIKEKSGLNANAYMGLIMAKFKGKVSGKEVMDELRRLGI